MSDDLVLLELNSRWNCDLPFGWVPMTGPAENSDELEIYFLEPLVDWFDLNGGIKSVIKNVFGVTSVYEVSEDGRVDFVPLEDCVFDYDGLEHMYTDASFQFLLYFSHESSVTAGGKALVKAIRQTWPEYLMHFWYDGYWLR